MREVEEVVGALDCLLGDGLVVEGCAGGELGGQEGDGAQWAVDARMLEAAEESRDDATGILGAVGVGIGRWLGIGGRSV
ncbi:MAG: hypothetical protein AABZ53_07015, partial [Planctomycetota bacterium]